ncbi:MAG: ATP-binding protein, partial [archaeon]
MTDYQAKNIQVLEGLEAVRKRPSMYIGSIDEKGLHHLVYEVIDNSIDEALAGHCSNIDVTINTDKSITIQDNGRGIPIDIHSKYNKSALEVVMTILHAGGKFDESNYKVSGGLHGVGISVVNALSEWTDVEIYRDGKIHHQKYERGKPTIPIETLGETTLSGTKITFLPDSQIFEILDFKYETLETRIRELAYLNKGINISLKDERNAKFNNFKFDGGIKSFVKHINKNKKPIHKNVIYFEREKNNTSIEIAMQYSESYSEHVYTFANNINTHEGGTHLVGFKRSLTRVANEYIKNNYKKEAKL